MSDYSLSDELTPEQRLRRYKKELEEMAEKEGKELKLSNPLKKKDETLRTEPGAIKATSPDNIQTTSQIRPPQNLVSPAKRELRESRIVPSKKTKDEAVSTKDIGRNLVMIKAREKAIDSSLKEIKNKKSMLELQFKRGIISRVDYERRLKDLVSQGHKLLAEKVDIDEKLARK